MEMTPEEAKSAMSLVTSEAHRLSSGRITSETFNQGLRSVAEQHYNSIDPIVLHSAIGKALNPTRGKQSNGNGKSQTELFVPEPKKSKKFCDLYRQWVVENDYIPDDKMIEYFAGVSSPSYIRSDMRKEGYEFEQIARGAGFKVTQRPKPVRTPEIVTAELADAIRNNNQVAAAARIMELMEMTKKA